MVKSAGQKSAVRFATMRLAPHKLSLEGATRSFHEPAKNIDDEVCL